MKPTFSIGDAIAAPFSLLKKKPLSLLVWGFLTIAAAIGVYSQLIPMLASLPVGPGEGTAALDHYVLDSGRMSLTVNALTPLVYLAILLGWTAAARATLSPGRGDAFAFLRIGMDELRVAVVYVAWFIGWYLIVLVTMLIGAALGFAVWSADQTAAIIIMVVYGLGVMVGATWLFLRLCLIAPVSLIVKDFAFARGWALSKGQVLKLLGLNLLMWLISIAMQLGLFLVVGAILVTGFFGLGLSWPQSVETPADLIPLARQMLVPGAIALIPLALYQGWAIALSAAPAINAARQLLDGGTASPSVLPEASAPAVTAPTAPDPVVTGVEAAEAGDPPSTRDVAPADPSDETTSTGDSSPVDPLSKS